jgi:hypothetical protein
MLSYTFLGQETRDVKMLVKSVRYFIWPRTINSLNLIGALMSLAFLITFVSVHRCSFNNFESCKYVFCLI